MSEQILIDRQEVSFRYILSLSLFPFLPPPHSSKEGAVILKVVSAIKCAIASR